MPKLTWTTNRIDGYLEDNPNKTIDSSKIS
jgi:hypothetical protein